MGTVRLRPGHVQPVWAGHPWVFAQAIASVDGAPSEGDPVAVVDPKGHFLGRGFYDPKSAIPVRLLTNDPEEPIEGGFIAKRIEAAGRFRRDLGLPNDETTGYRLVNGEGDRLAGLLVDVYGEVAVVQLLTPGMRRRADEIVGPIARVSGAKTILEAPSKTDGAALPLADRVLRGPEPKALAFRERGIEYELPLEVTQKTGFYFDQREHRAQVEALARGRTVLDAFAFVGAFGMAAARGGATEVTCLESSPAAIATGAVLSRRNGLAEKMTHLRADVKKALPEMAREGRHFGLVICDPPKLVPTIRHLERGRSAYRKLNANALKLTRPGSIFVTCSCSAALSPDELLKVLAVAARDAGRQLALFHLGLQGPDHPTPPGFAQGRYLKTAFFRVVA
jgi:23S rRNA (cytosine1962-C5)-methyltransferase